MIKLDRICCATDLSEAADEAIRQADGLARAYGARLTILHVVPVLRSHPLFPQLHAQALAELPAFQERAAQAVVERVTALTGRAVDDYDVEIGDGAPYAVVIERAEVLGADLVVVGSQGATGLRRLLLGSVADRVVRYARCPVWVARPAPSDGRILAATELSDASLPAVQMAADLARRQGAHLSVLYSLDLPTIPFVAGGEVGYLTPPIMPTTHAEMLAAASQRLEGELQSRAIEAESIIVDGSPAVEILRAAERLPVELVVVCTTGRAGLARLFLGSVAETVVRYAPCSVLVLRLEGREAGTTDRSA